MAKKKVHVHIPPKDRYVIKQKPAEVVKEEVVTTPEVVKPAPKKIVKIEREEIWNKLTEICDKLTTRDIIVEFTEDTRKLDAGIVYYIVHIRKPDARKVATRKTGIYFTKISDSTVHVQVINGTSMIVLFSNYSDNSQEDVFKYLESIVKKDMEFYENALSVKKPVKYKGNPSGGNRPYQNKGGTNKCAGMVRY